MAEYLVELYVPRTSAPVVASDVRRLLGGEELTREATAVRCVRSIFVPDDETWFLLYEATSADDVRAAARSVDLPVERIVEAVADVTATQSTSDQRNRRHDELT